MGPAPFEIRASEVGVPDYFTLEGIWFRENVCSLCLPGPWSNFLHF